MSGISQFNEPDCILDLGNGAELLVFWCKETDSCDWCLLIDGIYEYRSAAGYASLEAARLDGKLFHECGTPKPDTDPMGLGLTDWTYE